MGSLGHWTKSPKSLGMERTKGADTSSLGEGGDTLLVTEILPSFVWRLGWGVTMCVGREMEKERLPPTPLPRYTIIIY